MRTKKENNFTKQGKDGCYSTFFLGFTYVFSITELLKLNDYYIDFILEHYSSSNAISRCDTESLLKCINDNFKNTEPLKRRSAKIIATNDPVLNLNGVPDLGSCKSFSF